MLEYMSRHWDSPAWQHAMLRHMYGPRRYGMHQWMYGNAGPGWGWNSLWITLCVLIGLVLVAAVAYGAARLAIRRNAPA